jgi:hypothetical protein
MSANRKVASDAGAQSENKKNVRVARAQPKAFTYGASPSAGQLGPAPCEIAPHGTVPNFVPPILRNSN